jgi:peroxiredoxin
MLSRLQQDYEELGLRVVGIALDDPDDAREFADSLSIDYPVLVGLTDVVLVGRKYGNRSGMLPYTVLVDAEGIIRWTHLGALDRENLDQQIDLLK